MAAQIIAEVEVPDPLRYEIDRKGSSATIDVHGALVLIRGGRTERLEGGDPARIVVLGLPSFGAGRSFYDSPEYGRARENAAIVNMLVATGV